MTTAEFAIIKRMVLSTRSYRASSPPSQSRTGNPKPPPIVTGKFIEPDSGTVVADFNRNQLRAAEALASDPEVRDVQKKAEPVKAKPEASESEAELADGEIGF